jgi:hypothetical protein
VLLPDEPRLGELLGCVVLRELPDDPDEDPDQLVFRVEFVREDDVVDRV